MKPIIQYNEEKCVGCNHCARICPVETANLIQQREDGSMRMHIDQAHCISCGACLTTCNHSARAYADDTGPFLDALAAGEPLTVIAAPSIRTNFTGWRRLFSWLRSKGVQAIYDVSLGADIAVWAQLRYQQAHPDLRTISSACPAIVSYCRQHRHELLPFLSPVHTPMSCAALYLRKYLGIQGRMVALSPCPAKGREFETTGLIDMNVTFAKLKEALDARHIDLPDEPSDYDGEPSGLGALFPMPGGMRMNLEYFSHRSLRVDQAEGTQAFRLLDEYASTYDGYLPEVFDVLSCKHGCNMGPGGLPGKSFFQVNAVMDTTRETAAGEINRDALEAQLLAFDNALAQSDFSQVHTPIRVEVTIVTDAEIMDAFALLSKDTYAKRQINCGACGCGTCRDMARKIALGLNVPENCIVKSRDDAEQSRQRSLELSQRNADYIALVRGLGETLLSQGGGGCEKSVVHSLRILANSFGCNVVSLWERQVAEGGKPHYGRLYAWPSNAKAARWHIQDVWPEEWMAQVAAGHPLEITSATLPKGLFNKLVKSISLVPVIIRGSFWGFLAFINQEERLFDAEEQAVVGASGILIVSRILESVMSESLVIAREEALAGTRAKSDFLSRMSHEMRTPMNAILGMTQIAEGTQDADKLRGCMSTIRASSMHLLRLINDVLDMSSIEAGEFTLEPASFGLEDTLKNTCAMLYDQIERKQQKLMVHLSTKLASHYTGDGLRLSQVVSNLLGNACKFTPEHGSLSLSCDVAHIEGDRCTLRFAISDTGVGMDPETIDRLFAAFEQGSSMTAQLGGTGLGLAIARSIVERMDGRIWVKSEAGKGSTVSFEVVLRQDLAAQALSIAIPDGVSVLIASDIASCRANMRAMLLSRGIQCDASGLEGAQDAAAKASQGGTPYSLIILYPRSTSAAASLAKQLQAVSAPSALAVAASFPNWAANESSLRQANIAHHIALPVFPSSLLGVIQEATGQPPSAPQAFLTDLTGRRLLLAEDIEINRMILVELLGTTHAEIDEACDGQEAVDRFAAAPNGYYDAILMDIQMPRMNGYEATRSIRSLDRGDAKSVPIIAVTANAYDSDVNEAIEAGMNSHLSKPVDIVVLMQLLSELLAAGAPS